MTRAAFRDGKGAIVSASRSILYAHREKKYADRFGGRLGALRRAGDAGHEGGLARSSFDLMEGSLAYTPGQSGRAVRARRPDLGELCV